MKKRMTTSDLWKGSFHLKLNLLDFNTGVFEILYEKSWRNTLDSKVGDFKISYKLRKEHIGLKMGDVKISCRAKTLEHIGFRSGTLKFYFNTL